jgi:zinc and cadmium transporter
LNYFVYIAVFLSVIISGLFILFFKIGQQKLKLILSFSGAYLLGISMLHLLPEVYGSGTPQIGLYILIGFILQLLMEFFSQGIEHGHMHLHQHGEKMFPATMMIALSLHSFLEGMPLAENYTPAHGHTHNALLTGIVLHNIPIAMALMSMLLQSHISRKMAVFYLVLFALTTPLGTFSAFIIGTQTIFNVSAYFDRIMAVVVGIFLHISTTILFESSSNHRFNLIKFVVILLGVCLSLISI